MFVESGVERIVRECHELPMADLSSRLFEASKRFGAGRPAGDDITIVLIRRLPG